MTERERILGIINGDVPDRLPGFAQWDWCGTPAEHSMTFPESGPDWYGVQWYVAPDKTQVVQPGFKRFENMSVWKEANCIPDVDMIDWAAAAAKATAKWDRTNKVSAVHDASGHFERLHYLIGFEDSLMAFYEYPDEVHELFEAITELKIQSIRRIKKYYNPDVYCPHDDWGTNLNMFFSPDIWREFIKPHVKRMIDETHAQGMIFMQHSCGHITPVFDEMVEIGTDIFECQACNDLAGLHKKYGTKIAIDGGLNSQVINSPVCTYDVAYNSVKQTLLDCAIGGGYLTPTLGVPGGSEPEIRRACKDAFDWFNKEYYGYDANA